MASIEEIISTLQSANDHIGESISSAGGAESTTGDLISVMSAAGIADKVAELTAVKEAIEGLRTYLQGGVDLAENVINQARAAGG